MMSRIGLGTVQFGLDYGVSNSNGIVKADTVRYILDNAAKMGIRYIDTAAAYGISEQVIGDYIENYGNPDFEIISKLPPGIKPYEIASAIQNSKSKLKVSAIKGIMFHRASDINSNTWRELKEVAEIENISKIGVSAYSPDEIDFILHQGIIPDIVQIPTSILDRRFVPYFKDYRDHGIVVFARSIYLQGLFFLEDKQIVDKFGNSILLTVNKIKQIAAKEEIGLPAFLLRYVLGIDNILPVVGVTSIDDLKSLEEAVANPLTSEIENLVADIYCTDESVLLPYNWK